jgi:hypothetical protein
VMQTHEAKHKSPRKGLALVFGLVRFHHRPHSGR